LSARPPARCRHLLASASADRTVKLWDLTQGVCAASFTHHTDKVQSVQWNPREPTVLCTGSYDRTAAVLDARAPAQVSRWHLGTDVEAMAWNPFRPEYFMVGLDNGMVVCCDARVPEKPAYTVHAHDKAACGLAFSAFIPDCMVTSGVDKVVKVCTRSHVRAFAHVSLGPILWHSL
jgi:periodic tryptophan protein 1